jgi:regulation of enolase protein 1 (concanavalin A-like superfamily)
LSAADWLSTAQDVADQLERKAARVWSEGGQDWPLYVVDGDASAVRVRFRRSGLTWSTRSGGRLSRAQAVDLIAARMDRRLNG